MRPISDSVVLYTAVANAHDELKCPATEWSREVHAVAFVDEAYLAPNPWLLRPFEYFDTDPKRTVSWVKTHPHVLFPDHEWSIWIDANLTLDVEVGDLINDLAAAGAVMTAPTVSPEVDIYEHGAQIIASKRDHPAVVNAYLGRLREMGIPGDTTLFDTGVVVRRHHDKTVRELSRTWWAELDGGTRHDDLALAGALHRTRAVCRPLVVRGHQSRHAEWIAERPHRGTSTVPPKVPRGPVVPPPRVDAFLGRSPSPTGPPAVDALRPLDIVIPIHNARDDVERCLASLAQTVGPNDRVIVVDDGSDEDTAAVCEAFVRAHVFAVLIRRPEPSGFTKAANAGLAASEAPHVVVLNSDTVVPERWRIKLGWLADQHPDVGLISPMSNAASYQSLPETHSPEGDMAINALPPGFSIDDMDRFCEQWSAGLPITRVPQLNGFCLLATRSLLDTVGLLDDVAFPRGYGEEIDWCFRASDAGFGIAVATNTYVWHTKSRSYGDVVRLERAAASMETVRARWGSARVGRSADSVREHPRLVELRWSARSLWEPMPQTVTLEQ